LIVPAIQQTGPACKEPWIPHPDKVWVVCQTAVSCMLEHCRSTCSLMCKELAELVLSYVENFESSGSEGLTEALEQVIATVKEQNVQGRERRGTDWDESNSDYNVVASQGSRAADVRRYTNHRAYIFGKTIGISKANIKIGAELFVRHILLAQTSSCLAKPL